jgi:hypothetical protein
LAHGTGRLGCRGTTENRRIFATSPTFDTVIGLHETVISDTQM